MQRNLSILISLCWMVFPIAASAAPLNLNEFPSFNPNSILSDGDILGANTMTLDRLVNLLRSKGTLADRRLIDIDGIEKSIPDILWRVSHSYSINLKYLIVLLQKEQSLVEDPNPSQGQLDWATGYGVCDSCSKDDPDLQELKGFANQVEWAAKQHREKYLLQLLTSGLTIGGFGVGKTVSVDGISITPSNHATAMLYSYTPHIHGNLNLWKIWDRWFRTKFPDGSLVRSAETNRAYLIRFGEKRPFASEAVLASLENPSRAIGATEAELERYMTGEPIKFPKWALLREPTGRIYLYTGTAKRHIENMEAFRAFGFNPDEVIDVEGKELAAIPDGSRITTETSFPQGVLMRLAGTEDTFYIEDGVRHPIVHPIFLTLYFRGRKIRDVSAETISAYESGAPYRLHDGELIRSEHLPSVYVVERGVLRPILSAEVFEEVGWNWKSVVFLPDSLITLYTISTPFNPDEPATALASHSL